MAENATGTTVTFSSGFFAEILSITGPGGTRVSLSTSHMGTVVAHTFTPGDLVDWGSVTLEIQFEPTEDPPIDNAAETMSINWPDSAASVWSFSAFMTGFEPTATLEEIIKGNAEVKVTADLTVT